MFFLAIIGLYLLSLTSGVCSLEFTQPDGYTENITEGEVVTPEELPFPSCVDLDGSGDQGLHLTVDYSISSGDAGPIQIDNTTGELSVRDGGIFDYETTQSYSFTVTCVDTSDTSINASTNVVILIMPVNEFLPVVTPSAISVTLFENTFVGTVIVSTLPTIINPNGIRSRRYTVRDDDTGPDGDFTFTLSDDTTVFNLNRSTGSLVLTRSLDVDTTTTGVDRINVVILACDTNRIRTQCPRLDVIITVLSFNDHDPVFSSDRYETALLESSPNETLVATPMCTDADIFAGAYQGIEMVFPSAIFAIPDRRDGTVIVAGQLDYETSRQHSIMLRCYDNQRQFATAQLIVNVLPVNDNPPLFNASIYMFTVDHIRSLGGNQIGQVQAQDADQSIGNNITYYLTDNSGYFTINSENGIITIDSIVFIINGNTYNEAVVASDGLFSSRAEVVINVTGVLVSTVTILIIVMGILLLPVFTIVVVVCIVYCCHRYKRRKRAREEQEQQAQRRENKRYTELTWMTNLPEEENLAATLNDHSDIDNEDWRGNPLTIDDFELFNMPESDDEEKDEYRRTITITWNDVDIITQDLYKDDQV